MGTPSDWGPRCEKPHVADMAPSVPSRLSDHPNLKYPPRPPTDASEDDARALVMWALACASQFISPTKEDGEDEEIPCLDMAREVAGLTDRILAAPKKGQP